MVLAAVDKLPRATEAYPANNDSADRARVEIHRAICCYPVVLRTQCQALLGENNKRDAKRAIRGGWPLPVTREMSRVRKTNPAKLVIDAASRFA